MGRHSPMHSFQCEHCGALDLQVTGRLRADSPMHCTCCGSTVTTWRSFIDGLHVGYLSLVHAELLAERRTLLREATAPVQLGSTSRARSRGANRAARP
jgi:hypothetical protein